MLCGLATLTLSPTTGLVASSKKDRQSSAKMERKVAATDPTLSGGEEWIDHLTTAFRGTVSNEGNIGYINGFPGQGGLGSGFQFNPISATGQRLFEGAIMIGTDSTHVSNAARDENQVFDADFLWLSAIDTSLVGTTSTYSTSYNDNLAESPIGIRVDQTTFSFNEAGKDNILIVQLDLVNETGDNLSGVVPGAYFDWDVNSAGSDRGQVIVDSMNTIASVNNGDPFPFDVMEIHQGAGPNSWMGTVPLNENRFYGRRVAIQADEIYPPNMTDGDKWRYMTELRAGNENGDGGATEDHAHVFGLGPYDLLASSTKRVGFALVGGTSLQACIDAAQEAQRIWVEVLGNDLNIPGAGGPPPVESYSDLVTSAFRATISNEGNIGYINGFPGQGGVGSGFQFNPISATGQRLFEGAIMVGTDSTHVSNAARDENQVFDADFLFAANIDTTVNGTTTTYSTSYNDSLAESILGIRIDQATYSFNEAGKDNILIVQLDVVNETGDNLSGVVTGAYFDWDVNSAGSDRGAVIVDSMNTIPSVNNGDSFPFDVMELHQAAGPNSWMGTVPLNENRFYGRRIAIQADEVYPPHMTDGDKWRYMTELRAGNENGDGGATEDHGQVFGIGPYDILAASTMRVGFAMVAGTSLQACIDAAQEAQRIWVEDLGNTMNVFDPTDVNDPGALPTEFALAQNYPNPFNPSTSIGYALPEQAAVAVKVFNVLGQEVVTLEKSVQEAGYHNVIWNGKNAQGKSVVSGVYFYQFEAKGNSGKTYGNLKKMLFLK